MPKPPPRHDWGSWATITVVLFLGAVVGGGLLLVPKLHTAHLLARRGVVTSAEVVDVHDGVRSHQDSWRVEFTTATGERVRARTREVTPDEAARYPAGTRLPVRYDPRHPTRVWSAATPVEASYWWGVHGGLVAAMTSLGALLGLLTRPWRPPSPPRPRPPVVAGPPRVVPPRVKRERERAARRGRMGR